MPSKPDRSPFEDAARWVAIADAGGFTRQVQQEFDDWVRADAHNRVLFLLAMDAWLRANCLKELRALDDLVDDDVIRRFVRRNARRRRTTTSSKRKPRRRSD